jgi:hypothetical protein
MIVEVRPKTDKNAFPAFENSVESGKNAPMPCGIVNGKPLTDKENQEYQQQQTARPGQEQARGGPGNWTSTNDRNWTSASK